MNKLATKQKLSRRQQTIAEKIDAAKVYGLEEAYKLLQDVSTVKFKESVELSVNLGIDSRKSDQSVRGAVVLPSGTGKSVRVAVLTGGEQSQEARDAGADIVGSDDLIATIQGGQIDFDVLIATPTIMPKIAKLGQILGPRGLMPNPKVGTVSADLASAVTRAKAGQVRFRADKGGIIHCLVGKINFTFDSIQQNIAALLTELRRIKPSSSKGVYIKKITISSTMGPGLNIDPGSV